MLEESRMDKKSVNRSQPQPRASAIDCKKSAELTHKPWPRNNKKREGSGNAPKNEPSRKNAPAQRGRGQVDKRPRARLGHSNFTLGGAANTGLEDDDEPEYGSVFVPGTKKQNLNHLLNFMYPTRGSQSSGSERRGPVRHQVNRFGRLDQDLYLRAKPNLRNIEDLPKGVPLEQPLTPKRRRTWSPPRQPTTSAAQHLNFTTPPSDVQVIESAVPMKVETPKIEAIEVPQEAVPSPFFFVKCDGCHGGPSTSTPATPPVVPTRPAVPSRQPPSDADIIDQQNLGSESESEDSDGDDGVLVPMIIPRTVRMLLETPQDDCPVTPQPAEPSSSVQFGPTSFFDFKWTEFPDTPISPESRREIFSENVGPTAPCKDPYQVFTSIWDRQIMEHIAGETNRYAQELAQQMMNSNTLSPSSRICEWKDTTPSELYIYFAIVLAMGLVVKGRIEDYWSINKDIFETRGFRTHMPIRRFQLLNRCLHFNNNADMSVLDLEASEAKLFKIMPVIQHLNTKFQSLYNMRQNIALDESLLQWKGWLDINQFIPNKAATVGIKSYEVCESQTGYLWRFEIYAHKKPLSAAPTDPLQASTPAIVLKLLQGLENKGHTLWMDNFYNSPALARKLKTLGFDCVGTLRTNRQFVPAELSNLVKAKMRPGQITGYTSGDVDLMVWRDLNLVATISTYHGNAVSVVDDVVKPILIRDYNIMMGGVDKKDQMLATYPIERKKTQVWYKKLFRRFLNVSILNAYILAKQSGSPLSHRSFRINLINAILQNKTCQSDMEKTTSSRNVYDATVHHLAELPLLPGKSGRQRRVCTVCKKRVQFFCAGCDKTVCLGQCFVDLHRK